MKRPISQRVSGLSRLSLLSLLAVSIVSLASSLVLSKAFSGFLATSNEVVLIQKVSSDTVAARISAIKFRTEATVEVADITRGYLTSVVSTRDDLMALFSQGDVLAQVDAFYEDINLYWNEFEQALSQRQSLQASVLAMNSAETLASESLVSLMDSAHATSSHGATYFGGVALRDMLQAQVIMQNFLQNGDPSEFDASSALIEDARSALAKLTFLLSGVDQRAFVDTALQQMTTYLENATAVSQAFQQEQQHNQRLDALGPVLSENIRMLVEETTRQQEALGNSGTATVRQTIAALTVCTLLLFAFLFTRSRSLTRGIRDELAQSVSELKTLAEGDLTLDITRADEKTEIRKLLGNAFQHGLLVHPHRRSRGRMGYRARYKSESSNPEQGRFGVHLRRASIPAGRATAATV